MDYAIWSVIQQRVYETRVHDIDELWQRLLHVWCSLEHSLNDDAVDQWPTCSRACVPARGGYFERTLWPILFSLYLMIFMYHTRLDAAGDILRAHYKSMKCDVSFAQGSVSTIFRWGGHVSYMRKNSSWLQQCKIDGDFPQLRSQR